MGHHPVDCTVEWESTLLILKSCTNARLNECLPHPNINASRNPSHEKASIFNHT